MSDLELWTLLIRNIDVKIVSIIDLLRAQVLPPKWVKPLSRTCDRGEHVWAAGRGPLRHFHRKHILTSRTSESLDPSTREEWLSRVVSLSLRITLAINQAHCRHVWVSVEVKQVCPMRHQIFLWVMHKNNAHLDWVTVKSTPSGWTDWSMLNGWETSTMLSHLVRGVKLTIMRRIKATPTLIIGVDRGPFVNGQKYFVLICSQRNWLTFLGIVSQ